MPSKGILSLFSGKLGINQKDLSGKPYYFYAFYHRELIEKLLKRYPDLNLNIIYNDGDKSTSLLLHAVDNMPLDSIQKLLKAGADPNQTVGGRSPLEAAIQSGDGIKIKLLLEYGAIYGSPELLADKIPQTKIFEFLWLSLHSKTFPNQVRLAIVEKTKQLKIAIPESEQWRHDNFIVLALKNNNLDLAYALISSQIVDPIRASKPIFETGDRKLLELSLQNGLTLNHFPAATLHRPEVVEVFKKVVESDPSILNLKAETTTPFLNVIASGNTELYEWCLAKGAKINLEEQESVYDALSLCLKSKSVGAEKIIKDLIEKGLDLNKNLPADSEHTTVFSLIAELGSKDIILWCLDRGAKITPENPHQTTIPLDVLVTRKEPDRHEIFKLFTARILESSSSNLQKSFLVNHLIYRNAPDLLTLCFDLGLKLDTDEAVQEAFFQSFIFGRIKIFEILIQRGYKVDFIKMGDQKAEDAIAGSYTWGERSMLSTALASNPSQTALENGFKRLLPNLIEEDDYESFKLFEQKGAKFNPEEIVNTMSIQRLFMKNEKDTKVALEIIKRLPKDKLDKFLRDNVNHFKNNRNTAALKFAQENGVEPTS
jgi:ankyrin repeat protein